MSDHTKRKVFGAVKLVGGVARMASGVATGCGVGILGSFMKHHGMRVAAAKLANYSINGGKEMFKSGLADLRE
jgi:hypothetical protein